MRFSHIDVNFDVKNMKVTKVVQKHFLCTFWEFLVTIILHYIKSLLYGVTIFKWFKFTLKPPYRITHENLLSLIWDTSHWNSFLKFGLRTAYDMS